MNRFLSLWLLLLSAVVAHAQPQQPVLQSGSATPGHPPQFQTNGVIKDAGPATAGTLTGVGVTTQGKGVCVNSGPTNGPYQQLCLAVTTGGPGQIILQNFGGAAPQALQAVINGVAFNLPGGGGGGGVTTISNADGTLTIAPTSGVVTASLNLNQANTWLATQTFPQIVDTGLAGGGTQCVQASNTGQLTLFGAGCGGGGGGAVNSVSNSDGTLTISPTSGAVVASLALGHANTWTATQTFPNASITGAELGSNAAATNVGALGGVLGGFLPNPTMAAGAAATNVGTLGGALTGTLPNPSIATGAVTNTMLATMPADTVKCNNTGGPATPTDCTSVITKDYTSLASTSFWSNQVPPNNFINYGDKLFGGDMINNPNTVTSASNVYNATCSTGDWFSNFEATTSNLNCGYWPGFAMVVAAKNTATSVGNITSSSGILGAGQTKNSNFGGAFGVGAFALNNNVNSGTVGPAGAGGAWAIYAECDQTVNSPSSGCFGAEIETGNFVSDAFSLAAGSNPPDPFAQAKVNSLQVGCGSGLATPTPFKCAAAEQILDVGGQFRLGINIFSGSIAAQTIFGGSLSVAMAMPESYGILWYTAAASPSGGLEVDASHNLKAVATSIQLGSQTGSEWVDDSPVAIITRIADRLFVGGAASSTGQKPPTVASDWLGAYQNSIGSYGSGGAPAFGVIVSETSVTNANSLMGVVAGARTLNMPAAATGDTALALAGFGLADNSSLGGGSGAWGVYTECHREATGNGSICVAAEFEPRNNATGERIPDPFTPGFTVGVGLGCGAGVTSTGKPCGEAMTVLANPETFNAGITFQNGSISTQTIFGGPIQVAIALPPSYSFVWYTSAGTAVGGINIDSSGNVNIAGTTLKFNGVPITVP